MIKKITIFFSIAALIAVSYRAISYSNTTPPTGMTNAPLSGESNCTSCHSGSLITSGSDFNNVALTSNFSSGNGYLPDSVYTIKISHSQSGINKWGFQTIALDGKNNVAGKLDVLTSTSRVAKNSSGRTYLFHNATSGTSSTSTNATEWLFKWTAPKNIGDVKFYTCVMASNSSSNESGDQVYGKVFTINPSSLIPVADAKCKDSVTCVGTTITLNGTSTQNAKNWYWTFTGTGVTVSDPRAQNPTVKYANPSGTTPNTTYWAKLVSENDKAKSRVDSIKITVLAAPPAGISPNGGTFTLCKGDSLKINATGPATNSYTWSNGAVTQTIFAKDTGKYFVTATGTNKCSATSVAVRVLHHTVQTLKIASNASNDTICFERPIAITGTGSTTFDSILYYNSNGKFLTTASNPQTFKFSASTDLFAKGKDKNKCLTANSNKLNFIVNKGIDAPKVTCASKTSSSFEVNWSTVANALGYKVSIDSGKTWLTPSSGNTGLSHQVLGFPPNTDVEVYVKAIDKFPCYESEISKVVCGSIPCSPLTYDIEWDKDACKGETINFKIKNLNTTKFSLKINGAGPFKDSLFKITADFDRTYAFELTDSSNLSCPTIKRDAAVKVWEIPNLNLTSNSPQNIFCEGKSANFDVVSKGMQDYNFFVNSSSKQKSATATWTYPNPKNLDTVWVKVTNGACVSTSDKIVLGVSPLPSAKFNYTVANTSVKFTPSFTGNGKFYWDFGDGATDTVTKSPNHDYGTLKTALVKLRVIDEFGCESTDTLTIRISGGIKSFSDMGIKVYPQPAKNNLTIELPANLLNAELKIVDVQGRVVLSTFAQKRKVELNLGDLANGVYTLTVEKDKNQFHGKVIVNH